MVSPSYAKIRRLAYCPDGQAQVPPRLKKRAKNVLACYLVANPNRNRHRLVEGHFKVPSQIICILDADGNPDQILGDAKRGTHLRRCRSMSHQGWQRNQTFDTTKAFG